MTRTKITPAPVAEMSDDEIRAEYKEIRAMARWENPALEAAGAFEDLLREQTRAAAETGAAWLRRARLVKVPCGRCACTGRFITRTVNGKPEGPGGDCFRCNGKGYQDTDDLYRNRAYDRGGYAFRGMI